MNLYFFAKIPEILQVNLRTVPIFKKKKRFAPPQTPVSSRDLVCIHSHCRCILYTKWTLTVRHDNRFPHLKAFPSMAEMNAAIGEFELSASVPFSNSTLNRCPRDRRFGLLPLSVSSLVVLLLYFFWAHGYHRFPFSEYWELAS